MTLTVVPPPRDHGVDDEPEVASDACTDKGNARAFAAIYANRFRYLADRRVTFQWDDRRWQLATAVDTMRAYEPAEIFSRETPLVVGTPAEGWEEQLATYLQASSERALGAPDLGSAQQAAAQRAAARFLHGWASYLLEPTGSDVLANVERAAELAPNDPLYSESSSHLRR